MSNDSRLELKAAVMRARQKLADELPLQGKRSAAGVVAYDRDLCEALVWTVAAM